jgi:hypothetical protein
MLSIAMVPGAGSRRCRCVCSLRQHVQCADAYTKPIDTLRIDIHSPMTLGIDNIIPTLVPASEKSVRTSSSVTRRN